MNFSFKNTFLYLFIGVISYSVQAQSCLNYSTFFGQTLIDEIKGVCTDPLNNSYVIGNTYNSNLPVTIGAFQSTPKGSYEAFLAKFDSCGTLLWCTYFGTSGFDSGEKITYSADGTIVFTGYTDGADLATTPACFQSVKNGNEDCFIAKFTPSGMPIWITYFGAGAGDFSYDVKTDSFNNIVIGGTSLSNALYTNATSFQQFQAGATDAFIARFNAQGFLKFSTFFGGSNSEDIHAIAIDNHFNIIGVGGSFSFNLNMSSGCYQPTSNGGMEIYVLKLDSSGQRIFSTYIGTNGTDDAYGVCTDNSNNIYVSGHTNSTNFYTSIGAFQTTNAGQNDGYCLSLSPLGSMLWSTYLGGTGNDFMVRMQINSNKELIVLMNSSSVDFPMLATSNYSVNSGSNDAVIVKLLTNGIPFWSSYFGGSVSETPSDFSSFNKNKFVLVGATSSSDLPIFGANSQTVFAGSEDGFLSCISALSSTVSSIHEVEKQECLKYVNSSSNDFVIQNHCNNLKYLEFYNLLGSLILQIEVTDKKIYLNELSEKIYLVNGLDIYRNSIGVQKIIRIE